MPRYSAFLTRLLTLKSPKDVDRSSLRRQTKYSSGVITFKRNKNVEGLMVKIEISKIPSIKELDDAIYLLAEYCLSCDAVIDLLYEIMDVQEKASARNKNNERNQK